MAHFATYGKYPASHANRGSYRNFRLDSFGNRRNILRHLHMMQQTLQLRLLAGRRRPQTTPGSLHHVLALSYGRGMHMSCFFMFLISSSCFFRLLHLLFWHFLSWGSRKRKNTEVHLQNCLKQMTHTTTIQEPPQATSLHTCKSFKYWPVVESHPHLLTIVVLPH